jgi:UDP-N-acetyl-D-mannosaminuronate dehydrogenase
VDPGRTEPPARSISKIISGPDDTVPGSLKSISTPYSAVFESIVPISRSEAAETTKLYENCQRMAMITYANEMADACIPHGVDP